MNSKKAKQLRREAREIRAGLPDSFKGPGGKMFYPRSEREIYRELKKKEQPA